MTAQDLPMIVGAGPVGLGAALFLARQGRSVRIVESLHERSKESRALAVNPRTLEILEPTGLTRQMLELGKRIYGVCFHHEGKLMATMELDSIHPKYPFMLALSQASTELLLERALLAAGGMVERGVKLVNCRASDEGAVAVLEPAEGGTREVAEVPWLLAADGAHSTVREKLKLDFPGSSLDEEWYLADVPLKSSLPQDHGHLFFFEGGSFLFMIRVVDQAQEKEAGGTLWRLITNRPNPLSRLVGAEQAGGALWASSFRISHRIVAMMAIDNVYFAGDAAHLHSPMGARGMNLGLEDAWVFSELLRTGRLAEYHDLRYEVDKSVVHRVELLTRMVAAESPLSRLMREFAFPVAVRTPVLRGRMLAAVTGLDHDLPDFSGNQRGHTGFKEAA
jgi:2-polyprenyl-6-methoxyphenol hydroxylase-like FAD-dependent oxidoreductase